ncbi:MAG TPA: tetratricopeptide repeat protein [Actinomycetota bacterium]|nr:tetratricopeptide repeat protein [Actinomycetota bacterium]
MTGVVISVCVLLAAVAAAGVLRPFGRRVEPLDPLPDAAEEERRSALRALRDLERDRESGSIEEDEYQTLRAETEARAVATLRSVNALSAASALKPRAAEQPPWSGNGSGTVSRRRRIVPTVLLSGLVAAAVVSVLLSTARPRPPGQPFTGGIPGSTSDAGSPASAIRFFEQRVQQYPGDLAARLDLAERYLQAGRMRPAIDQYLAALQIDPRNTEARATLGFVVYRAGRTAEGLRIVNEALAADPSYPEALFYKGVILLQGMERPAPAAEAFSAYLRAAPFGAQRAEARRFLTEAQRAAASD